MAVMGRPKKPLVLTEEERATLKRYLRRAKTSQTLALRSRIVLRCEKVESNSDVALELGIDKNTVGKWRNRFIRDRLEGLLDAPRVGAPRKVTDDAVEAVVDATLNTKPAGSTHWSTRTLAKKLKISPSTVGRIWRAFGLQPHRTETFSLSNDPQFTEKVRDIVGLYMNPPDNALVLCVDEKSQIQALDRHQPLFPTMPAYAERRTHNYLRHGTTTLFAALDVATGQVIGKCSQRHRAKEFVAFLKLVDKQVPDDLDIHMILDNYATHKTPIVKRWLLRNKRFHLHFTPTYSSWLNLVESFFSLVDARVLKRGVHRSTHALVKDIKAFLGEHNDDPRPYVWTKSADKILESIRRYCESLQKA